MVELKKAGSSKGTNTDNRTILIYGPHGVGKTTIGAMLKSAVIVLTEPHGLQSIQDANPDATYALVKDYEEVLSVIKAATEEGLKCIKNNTTPVYEWIVFDSITDIVRMLQRYMLASKGRERMGRDDWPNLTMEINSLVDKIRRIPFLNKLYIMAEGSEIVDPETDSSYSRRVPSTVGSKNYYAFTGSSHLIGRLIKGQKSKERLVVLDMPDTEGVSKGHANLKALEYPRLDEWIVALKRGVDPLAFAAEYGGLNNIPVKDKEEAKDDGVEAETKHKVKK